MSYDIEWVQQEVPFDGECDRCAEEIFVGDKVWIEALKPLTETNTYCERCGRPDADSTT